MMTIHRYSCGLAMKNKKKRVILTASQFLPESQSKFYIHCFVF